MPLANRSPRRLTRRTGVRGQAAPGPATRLAGNTESP
jgi:hypothetical protein